MVVSIAHLNVTETAMAKRQTAKKVIPERRSITNFDTLSDEIERKIDTYDSFVLSCTRLC